MTNPLTQAWEALAEIDANDAGASGALAREAVAALDVLDHEAATEEWRCDKCGGTYAERVEYHTPRLKRACCHGTLRPILVVPFRSEGGDHA